MRVYENKRVADFWIEKVRQKLFDPNRFDGSLHASEIFQCLRRSFLDRTLGPVKLDRKSILQFAVGFALQEWFFGPEEDGEEVHHVIFSADKMMENAVEEFKSTRISYERKTEPKDDDQFHKHDSITNTWKFDPSGMDHWIKRTRAYCAVHGVKTAHIVVFFIFQTELSSWTVEFDDDDIAEAKAEIEDRSGQLYDFIAEDELPPVATRSGDWECKFCPRRSTHCLAELKREGVDVSDSG